jgi:hypothetical protein
MDGLKDRLKEPSGALTSDKAKKPSVGRSDQKKSTRKEKKGDLKDLLLRWALRTWSVAPYLCVRHN